MKRNYGVFASILLIIIAFVILFVSDYRDDKPYSATYLGAVQTSGRSGSIEGVFRLDNGKIVDVTISPSSYVLSKIGEKYIINLNDSRINPSTSKNLFHILLPFLMLGSGLFGLLIFWLSYDT